MLALLEDAQQRLTYPNDPSIPSHEMRTVEHALNDIDVDDLDPDVTVEASGNDTRNER